jgi:pyrroline-5-carboxylate reductase
VFAANDEAIADAGTWVLAAKPQVLRQACEALADAAQRQRSLVVSIAAGITADKWPVGSAATWQSCVRCRTCPPCSAPESPACSANPQVDPAGCMRAEQLLRAAGDVVWLTNESLMDAVTAVSGSGPAYVFLLAEAMLDAARDQGLPPTRRARWCSRPSWARQGCDRSRYRTVRAAPPRHLVGWYDPGGGRGAGARRLWRAPCRCDRRGGGAQPRALSGGDIG